MTIEQRINKFVKKYPEPYQFKIALSWNRKDGRHAKVYFPKNTTNSNTWRTPNNGFSTSTGRDFIIQHYRYDEKLGLLELAFAIFDCHVPKKGENRRWKYGYRYFIPKDTRELYREDGKKGIYPYTRTSYEGYCYEPYQFAQNFTSLPLDRDMFIREFMAFAGNNTQTANSWRTHITTDSHPWQLVDWFKYKPKTKTTGKVQKAIDELTAKKFELPDDARDIIISKMKDDNYNKKYAWFDFENKVFRCFVETTDGIHEDKRVYLTDKKPIVTTINPTGEWVTNRSFTTNQFNFKIVNIDEVCKLQYCGYFKHITKDETTIYRIVTAVKYPEIEQLANMGLYNIASRVFHADRPQEVMIKLFGEPNKKRNVLAKYNITKKQAEYVDAKFDEETYRYSYYGDHYNGVAYIKKLMNIDNVSSLDYDNFVKYYKFVCGLDWSARRCIELIPYEIRQKTIIKLCNMYDKHDTAIRLFIDTLNSYRQLAMGNRPNIDVYALKSYGELVRLHDAVIKLKRLQDEECRRFNNLREEERHAELEKKMAKLDKERIKLNYSDDNFTIRLPEKLSEIVNEGSSLRHCVGGYTNNHAQGNTTIMFLRRNDDPTTSFYTIEIRNDNSIQQIHGFGNKWLGNNPEAIPTVMRWLRANNLSCTDQILLSTAKGYGAGNAPWVEKPVI